MFQQLLFIREALGELRAHVNEKFHHVIQEIHAMSTSLDTLTAEVAQVKTVAAAATAALTGLKSQLDAAIAASKAGDNHAALDALSADLATSITPLAAAIPANTDAAPLPAAQSTT